jgi:hypothetical protein
MHLIHPPGSGHTLYPVKVRNLYESLANFISCFLAKFLENRSKSTLTNMWLHHKNYFVHPPQCGHTQYTVGVKKHDKSLANSVSYLLVEFYIDIDENQP